MPSILGNRLSISSKPSPLEGPASYYGQGAGIDLKHVGRREWWLWFSAFIVTLLSISALVLSFWRPFFRRSDHFYEIRADQAQWGTAGLLLIFNSWLVYRQWSFRRQRRELTQQNPEAERGSSDISDNPTGIDPVTGMYTRASIEPHLGKEIGRAKRQNTLLSLATLHLDDFEQVAQRYGQGVSDLVLKEFVRKFKKAIRGSDFAVRLGKSDFALVLPECSLDQVKTVLNRIGSLEVSASGKKIAVTYSTGWVDYHAGDIPGDLIKRALEILHLYETAAQESSSTLTAAR